jgi:hypothetical protein
LIQALKSYGAEIAFIAGCALVAVGLWRWSPSLALMFVGGSLMVGALIVGAPDVVLAICGRHRTKVSD